jgi:hypothetical protein
MEMKEKNARGDPSKSNFEFLSFTFLMVSRTGEEIKREAGKLDLILTFKFQLSDGISFTRKNGTKAPQM